VTKLPKCGFAVLHMSRGMGKTLVSVAFSQLVAMRKRREAGMRAGERRPLTVPRATLRRPAPDLFGLCFTDEYLRVLRIKAPFQARSDTDDVAVSAAEDDKACPASGAGCSGTFGRSVAAVAARCPKGPYPQLLAAGNDLPTEPLPLSSLTRLSQRCLKGKTLVIAPPSVLGEWDDALRHAAVPQKIMRWEGTGRHARLALACDADWVLVSSALMRLEATCSG